MVVVVGVVVVGGGGACAGRRGMSDRGTACIRGPGDKTNGAIIVGGGALLHRQVAGWWAAPTAPTALYNTQQQFHSFPMF